MNRRCAVFGAGFLAFTPLLANLAPAHGADDSSKNSAADMELICLTEQPAAVEGAIVSLNAWASTSEGRPLGSPVSFAWEADAGRIEGQTAATRWDLSAVKVESREARKVTATVTATQPGGSELRCSVQVFIDKKQTAAPNRGPDQSDLISARQFLLPGDSVEPGFGLYSYLLFSAPPKSEDETARYLKTIEACLLVLQDVDEYLRRNVRPRNLNATYMPVKKMPEHGKSNTDWAVNVMASYDYAAAQILLSSLSHSHEHGPYLVSVLQPLPNAHVPAHLWEDFTGVVPELAWDWVRYFTYLSAQERGWSEASLRSFALKLRNLIAVGGKVTPDVLKALEEAKAIQFMPKD
jgi:hypothetical protein